MEVSKEELLRAARDEGWSELVARPPIDENRADDIAAAVGMIRAGISALAEAGIDGVDDRNLLDSVLDVERETARLSAAQGKLLAEVDVRRAYGIEGCVTTACGDRTERTADQPTDPSLAEVPVSGPSPFPARSSRNLRRAKDL